MGLDSAGGGGVILGTKYYFTDAARLIANYGTNCIWCSGGKYHSTEGFNFGVGYAFGRNQGWAFDLMLADITECNKKTTQISQDTAINLSVGYRF